MLDTTTITTKGQVTIPVQYRQKLKLNPGQKVQFIVRDAPDQGYSELVVKPILDFSQLQGILKTNKKYSKAAARKAISQAFARGEKL